MFSFFLGKNTQKCRSGIVDLYVKYMFNFMRSCQLFPKVAAFLKFISHT